MSYHAYARRPLTTQPSNTQVSFDHELLENMSNSSEPFMKYMHSRLIDQHNIKSPDKRIKLDGQFAPVLMTLVKDYFKDSP